MFCPSNILKKNLDNNETCAAPFSVLLQIKVTTDVGVLLF